MVSAPGLHADNSAVRRKEIAGVHRVSLLREITGDRRVVLSHFVQATGRALKWIGAAEAALDASPLESDDPYGVSDERLRHS